MKSFNFVAAALLAASLGGGLLAAGQATPAPPASTSTMATMSALQALAANPQLTARIQPFLPEKTSVQKAANGFQDVGTFLATVHIAHNQQLSFDALKTSLMTGNAKSLVQAVQTIAPQLPSEVAQEAVQMAQRQAQIDIGAASQGQVGY